MLRHQVDLTHDEEARRIIELIATRFTDVRDEKSDREQLEVIAARCSCPVACRIRDSFLNRAYGQMTRSGDEDVKRLLEEIARFLRLPPALRCPVKQKLLGQAGNLQGAGEPYGNGGTIRIDLAFAHLFRPLSKGVSWSNIHNILSDPENAHFSETGGDYSDTQTPQAVANQP